MLFGNGPLDVTGRSEQGPHPKGAGEGGIDGWIVVLEFSPEVAYWPVSQVEVDGIVERLDEWNPTPLWHPDGYVIQLHIPARDPVQALQQAVALHREASTRAGADHMVMVRAEVLTVDAMERSWFDDEPTPGFATAPPGAVGAGLQTATRCLIAATTRPEVYDIVTRFVTGVGAEVQPGAARRLPGMIDIDLDGAGGDARHATAEALSVAGLILEQALPTLLRDAGVALARIDNTL